MLNRKPPLTPAILGLRTQYAAAWVTRWQTTVSHALLAVIERNHLTLHSATNGDWIASVNWGSERIIVTAAQGESAPYGFDAPKAAFIFLDAVLTHYATTMDEVFESTDQSFLPMAGAL